MKEADGEKAAKQGLLDGTHSRKRSLRNSKAGRGLLLGLVTVALILLCSSRLMFGFTSLFTPRDPSTTGASQGNARVPVVEHPQAAAAGFDEASLIGEDDSSNVGRGNASDVEDELEKLEAGDGLQDDQHHANESYDPEPGEARLDDDESKTEGNKLSDHENLNGDSEESAAEEDAAPTDEDPILAEEDAAPTEEDPAHAEEDAAAHAKDGGHQAEDAELEEDPEETGNAGEKKVPDAMAYLARLAKQLTKMTTDVEEGNGPYHNRRIFEMEYAEMKRSMKIFVYPYNSRDPFVNIYEPITRSPTGNYASEEFFQQALYRSGFVTKDAGEANFFFMPVSITKARQDKRINVEGLKNFCAKYVTGVRENYGHWNRSNGADHFYLSCHSIARSAMDEVPYVRENAIQLLCPSSYYLPNYITHKDAAVPQIWPRPHIASKELTNLAMRTRLAFFAGSANSPVRQELVRVWGMDDKILIHQGRVPYPYSQGLMTSKFCLQARGFEVNTARLGDSMFYGCVPVVIADYYDLPWQDILDWSKFSIVVAQADIPLLKEILEAVSDEKYAELHKNVMLARKHFIWHSPAHEYDAFHTAMHELWKRRHIVRRPAVQ